MTEFAKDPSLESTASSGAGKSSAPHEPASSFSQGQAPKVSTPHWQTASTDQAGGAGHGPKDKIVGPAAFSSDTFKKQTTDPSDSAKDLAFKGGEKSTAQAGTGADKVGNIAGAMRRAAQEFEKDVPFAATYIKKGADQLEGISNSVRGGNFSDLAQGAQAFARRQPFVFLGLTVLAAFGLVRFIKSSVPANQTPEEDPEASIFQRSRS